MPLNVDQTLIDALKGPIEARVPVSALVDLPALAVRAYRWRSDPDAVTQDVQNDQPAAYPYVTGEITRSSWRRQPATFGDMLGPDDLRVGVPGSVEITVALVFETAIETEQTPIEALIHAAIVSLGPKLGIRWVAGVTIRKQRGNENTRRTGNERRMVVTFVLTIDVRPGNYLLV